MPLDVRSSEDAITIEAALPGVRTEDVEITVHQDTLTIAVREAAERESSEGERVYREVRRSRGSRTLTLPSGLDVDARRCVVRERPAGLDDPSSGAGQAAPDLDRPRSPRGRLPR